MFAGPGFGKNTTGPGGVKDIIAIKGGPRSSIPKAQPTISPTQRETGPSDRFQFAILQRDVCHNFRPCPRTANDSATSSDKIRHAHRLTSSVKSAHSVSTTTIP